MSVCVCLQSALMSPSRPVCSVNIEDAKVIHKCLKQAAGLFLYLKVCIVRYMCSVGHSQCVSMRASSLIWVLDYMDVHFVIVQLKMVSF